MRQEICITNRFIMDLQGSAAVIHAAALHLLALHLLARLQSKFYILYYKENDRWEHFKQNWNTDVYRHKLWLSSLRLAFARLNVDDPTSITLCFTYDTCFTYDRSMKREKVIRSEGIIVRRHRGSLPKAFNLIYVSIVCIFTS